ncbi:MAG: BON domain-containing protein [Chitinivibrionales bacterium]|nr:BON domain-containing protein [Chitinivibrionales bacterium]
MAALRLSPRHSPFMQLNRHVITICLIGTVIFACPIAAQQTELTDGKITDAIHQELFIDDAVSSHLIDIGVEKGIATLTGTVDNILAEERAVKLAQSVKGVRSVIDRLLVKPVARSDNEIRRDVITALAVDPVTESYEVRVNVDDGVATLTGEVQSWDEKKLCKTVTKSVKGVRKIVNNISINFTVERSDNEIKNEIEKKLKLDPYVSGYLITVEVANGNVVLDGTVGSAIEKNYAYSNCLVNGVNRVDDSGLAVNAELEDTMQKQLKFKLKSDDAIKRALKSALTWNIRTREFDIEVEVQNMIVTLDGLVDNLAAKQAAGKTARNTSGVISVNNMITVTPAALSDEEIARNVKNALIWDPILERHEITPQVRNRKVYLYGAVDNIFEKQRAAIIASNITGVADVSNEVSYAKQQRQARDEQIKSAIKDQLYWNWYTEANDVTIRVEDGIAHIGGKVDNHFERNAIVREAFDGGAHIVESKIQVSGYPREFGFRAYYNDDNELIKDYHL